MKIIDFLLGKENVFVDQKIGTLKARIKHKNPSISYTWTGEHKLPNQNKKTVFILEGNIDGPHIEQLASVHKIIDDLKSITNRVSAEVRKNIDLKGVNNDNWVNELYLEAVIPLELRENSFTVVFEPINVNDSASFSFNWKNGKIFEIEWK